MTVTFAHNCQAQDAVKNAIYGASGQTMETINGWLKANSAFETLADLVATTIAHNYRPTIRPVAESAKAYREADMVANAFDAACTWAFGAGTAMCAYRGATPVFHRKQA